MRRNMLRTTRTLALAALVGGLGVLAMPTVTSGSTAMITTVAEETEDVLYLRDGRVLRGKILEEDQFQIRFEVVDRKLDLRTKLTIFRDDVIRIERDQAVKTEAGDAGAGDDASGGEAGQAGDAQKEIDPSVPKLYVIPIKGQMGTDVRPEVYDEIIEDVKAADPDCIVFELDCDAFDYNAIEDGQGIARGHRLEYYNFEEYRELATSLKNELSDYRQVMWIKTSRGVSSILALAWNEIYVTEGGLLDGLYFIDAITGGWQDDDVRAKMQAAFSGIVKGFMELGGHDLDLGHAMMFPEAKLSCSFKGREVLWHLDDTSGEIIVDQSDEATAAFTAANARDLGIAEEMVQGAEDDQFSDLAFLLGYREYQRVGENGVKLVNEYIEDWRAMYDHAEQLWRDYQQYRGWAQGEDTVKYLGRARGSLEKILAAMRRYKAIEMELERNYGLSIVQLELMIEEIRNTIRDIRNQERNRGRGGGGGGGRGPGIPGGGG